MSREGEREEKKFCSVPLFMLKKKKKCLHKLQSGQDLPEWGSLCWALGALPDGKYSCPFHFGGRFFSKTFLILPAAHLREKKMQWKSPGKAVSRCGTSQLWPAWCLPGGSPALRSCSRTRSKSPFWGRGRRGLMLRKCLSHKARSQEERYGKAGKKTKGIRVGSSYKALLENVSCPVLCQLPPGKIKWSSYSRDSRYGLLCNIF